MAPALVHVEPTPAFVDSALALHGLEQGIHVDNVYALHFWEWDEKNLYSMPHECSGVSWISQALNHQPWLQPGTRDASVLPMPQP